MSKKIISIMIIFSVIASLIVPIGNADVSSITLMVNGKNITALSEPVIRNDRVLVPIRFVAEELGAQVSWDAELRTVTVKDDKKAMKFWIGSRLVEFDQGAYYKVSDVIPTIINDRSYIPVRIVSEALNAKISWDGDTRTVVVDGSKDATVTDFYSASITSPIDEVNKLVKIDYTVDDETKLKAEMVKLLLLDPISAKGYVVRTKDDVDGSIYYSPKAEDQGNYVLALAFYDVNGSFIDGKAIPIVQEVKPSVSLNYSVTQSGGITLSQSLDFRPRYVNYTLKNISSGYEKTINQRDPLGSYTWVPLHHQAGDYLVKVTAVDGNGNSYESPEKLVSLSPERYLNLLGVSEGEVIHRNVNLMASRNYDVTNTKYIIRNQDGSNEKIIADIPYGSFSWFPDSEYSGKKQLLVQVTRTNGIVDQSKPINVIIDGSPKLTFSGVSPRQVITSDETLYSSSNTEEKQVAYYVKNNQTGASRLIGTSENGKILYSPLETDGTDISLFAEMNTDVGTLTSDEIRLKAYHGETYGPKPLIAKDQFKDMASELALASLEKTGMSAALQTAQAIHETGWGQYIPVDKYSGKFSYNMFGIKGTGTNGSVISNTWEVYNGVTVRIDDAFRAFNNKEEAWDNHKALLLNYSRYEPYRQVMYDTTQGAWAIWRCGYATDPQYPIKLMNVIDTYGLKKLDETTLK